MNEKSALVVSAHAADFVWRCGGAIALHQARGYAVTIVCLSYGERGESANLWKQDGMTLAAVKAARRDEAERAAAALGAHQIVFFDLGDYPLRMNDTAKFRLVDIMRQTRPQFILTHSQYDPYNIDHMNTTHWTLECRMIAQAWGYRHNAGFDRRSEGLASTEPSYARAPASEGGELNAEVDRRGEGASRAAGEVGVDAADGGDVNRPIGAPQVYLFEPHQTEQMGWKPDVLLDISSVWDSKRAAIECMAGQRHLWDYYTNVAVNRANHFLRNSGGQAGGRDARYAEGFQSIFPRAVDIL